MSATTPPPPHTDTPTAAAVDVHVSGQGNVYMAELADQLVDAIRTAGRSARLAGDELPAPDGRHHLVVAPHEFFPLHPHQVPEDLAAAAAASTCVNTEQPGSPWFDLAAEWAVHGSACLDINPLGASALRSLGVDARRLPLGWTQDRDRWHRQAHERPVDLVFLGDATPRRIDAIARDAHLLADHRCELRFFRSDRVVRPGRAGFLTVDDRVSLLARSRVLLNIHRGERPYLEWVRVLDALVNGCALVSELSTDLSPLVPGQHLLHAPVEHLVVEAAALLAAEHRRRRMAEAAYDLVRSTLSMPDLVSRALDDLPAPAPAAAAHPSPGVPVTAPDEPPPDEGQDVGEARASLADPEPLPPVDVVDAPGLADHHPDVSVVVVARDRAGDLRDAVTAALACAAWPEGAEVVVVDVASRDRTRAVAEELLRRHPWAPLRIVGMVRPAPADVAAAVGAAHARGRVIVTTDARTTVRPGPLRRAVEAGDELGTAAVRGLGVLHGPLGATLCGLPDDPPPPAADTDDVGLVVRWPDRRSVPDAPLEAHVPEILADYRRSPSPPPNPAP